jgi:hypothetical protein
LLAAACIAYITATLSLEPLTRLIALTNRPILLNYHSRSIQQSGNVGSNAASNPYSAAGLLGDGQIIGVADTGLDVNMCYFSGPNESPYPFSYVSSPIVKPFRKVVMYANIEQDYGDVSDSRLRMCFYDLNCIHLNPELIDQLKATFLLLLFSLLINLKDMVHMPLVRP